jgi:hypothetical protein
MNITRVEEKLMIISQPIGVSVYDFDFDLHFRCTHPHALEGIEPCVLRIGPILEYEREFNQRAHEGFKLINSPSEHLLASVLEAWYPKLVDLTPRSKVFDELPTIEEIEADFLWPVFLKGSRQTSSHNPELSVIRSAADYRNAFKCYRSDRILHWQKPVVREFVPLLPAPGSVPGKVKPSLEFRSFWWRGRCVGWGQYWYQIPAYEAPDIELGLDLARQAVARLQVPFLVVDFAKTLDGKWIVIECNDAQESGYAAIFPPVLWRNILDSANA